LIRVHRANAVAAQQLRGHNKDDSNRSIFPEEAGFDQGEEGREVQGCVALIYSTGSVLVLGWLFSLGVVLALQIWSVAVRQRDGFRQPISYRIGVESHGQLACETKRVKV